MTPWSADKECPYDFYPAFKHALNQASYHFADESGSEWSKGYLYIDDAVKIAMDNQLPFWVMQRMVKDSRSLVDFEAFMSRLLRTLYRSSSMPTDA